MKQLKMEYRQFNETNFVQSKPLTLSNQKGPHFTHDAHMQKKAGEKETVTGFGKSHQLLVFGAQGTLHLYDLK